MNLTPKLNRKTNQYEVRFWIKNGDPPRPSKRFPIGISYDEAKTLSLAFYNSCQTGKPVVSETRPTLAACFQSHFLFNSDISKNNEKQTKRYLEKKYIPLLPSVPVEDLTVLDIEKYKKVRQGQKGYLGKTTQGATINREMAVLLGVINWCCQKGIIKTSPFAGKNISRLPVGSKRGTYFTLDEWHRFLAVFTDREALLKDVKKCYRIIGNQKEREAYLFNAGRAGDLFFAQLLTCCRIGELLSLRWSAVGFKTGSVSIKQFKTGITKHQNLTPELRSIFEGLEKVSSDKATCFVFERADGKPFPINQAENFFKVGVRLAGIQKYDGRS